jgi:hypothetical protein
MVDFVCSVCEKKVSSSSVINKPVPALNNAAHAKCKDAIVIKKTTEKVQKAALSAKGKEDGKARKAQTGRDHQGNHDSKTKKEIRGGPKGDKHAHGVNQAGRAGGKT